MKYIDVYINCAALTREMHSRLLYAAHRVAGGDLAPAWPHMGANKASPLGDVVRFFGQDGDLKKFIDYVKPLFQNQLISISGIRKALKTDRYVAYVRDRSIDKQSGTERRRCRMRGYAPSVRKNIQNRFRIEMESVSTKQQFFIFLKRISITDRTSWHQASKNGYGLGVLLADF